MGGWASDSRCDLTDRRSGRGAGTGPPPRGHITPGLGPAEDTEGPDPFSDPPLHLNTASPQPPAAAGPSSPTSSPLPGPSAPWRPAGGAKPPLSNPGPLAPGSGSVFWPEAPHLPNLCSLPPPFPYCEKISPLPPAPTPAQAVGPGELKFQTTPRPKSTSPLSCAHWQAAAGAGQVVCPVGICGSKAAWLQPLPWT